MIDSGLETNQALADQMALNLMPSQFGIDRNTVEGNMQWQAAMNNAQYRETLGKVNTISGMAEFTAVNVSTQFGAVSGISGSATPLVANYAMRTPGYYAGMSSTKINWGDPTTFTRYAGMNMTLAEVSLIKQGWVSAPTNVNRIYSNGIRLTNNMKGHQIRLMNGGLTRSTFIKRGPYMEINGGAYRSFILPLQNNPTLLFP